MGRLLLSWGTNWASDCGLEFEFCSSIEIRQRRTNKVTYPVFSYEESRAEKKIWIGATVSWSRALNHSANFHHWSQTTALFWTRVLGSQGGTLYVLNTRLPFGVVPPCRGVITVTVTFFVLSHRRKKMESLFFPPALHSFCHPLCGRPACAA